MRLRLAVLVAVTSFLTVLLPDTGHASPVTVTAQHRPSDAANPAQAVRCRRLQLRRLARSGNAEPSKAASDNLLQRSAVDTGITARRPPRA